MSETETTTSRPGGAAAILRAALLASQAGEEIDITAVLAEADAAEAEACDLAALFAAARGHTGLTCAALGDKLGVSRATAFNWAQGRGPRSWPALCALAKLARGEV